MIRRKKVKGNDGLNAPGFTLPDMRAFDLIVLVTCLQESTCHIG